MTPGRALTPSFGWLVGPGSGMALIFILAGLIGASTSLGGFAFSDVRSIEDLIPDHDTTLPALAEIATEMEKSSST